MTVLSAHDFHPDQELDSTASKSAETRPFRVYNRASVGCMRTDISGIPHPNLSDKVNRNIVRSEIEGGVYLNNVALNTTLEVETQNRRYTLWIRDNGEVLMWGHPVYCPAPTPVRISGSNWGGSMLKAGFIGRGMHMEFRHPEHETVVTSRVREVREVSVTHRAEPVSLTF